MEGLVLLVQMAMLMEGLFMGMTVKSLLVGMVVSMKMMFEWVMIMMVMMTMMIAVVIEVLVFAIMVMVMKWMILMMMMSVVMMRMMSKMVVVVVMVIMVENLMYQFFLEVNPFGFKTWEEKITQQSQRVKIFRTQVDKVHWLGFLNSLTQTFHLNLKYHKLFQGSLPTALNNKTEKVRNRLGYATRDMHKIWEHIKPKSVKATTLAG